jgi:hypothetical protein
MSSICRFTESLSIYYLFIYLFQNLQTKTCPKNFFFIFLHLKGHRKIIDLTEKTENNGMSHYQKSNWKITLVSYSRLFFLLFDLRQIWNRTGALSYHQNKDKSFATMFFQEQIEKASDAREEVGRKLRGKRRKLTLTPATSHTKMPSRWQEARTHKSSDRLLIPTSRLWQTGGDCTRPECLPRPSVAQLLFIRKNQALWDFCNWKLPWILFKIISMNCVHIILFCRAVALLIKTSTGTNTESDRNISST